MFCQQTRSQLWSEVAEKITIAVQQIIEFAKMLPGFMDLSQDDQIMLLKAGTEWGVDPTISVLEDIAWEGWIHWLGWDGGCKLRILYML